MTEGLGLQFWPLTKLTTEQTVNLIKTHLPQWCGIFRLLQGEGSDDYDFYKDPETLLKGLEVAKAFDAPVIVPLNSYYELMYQKHGATYKDKAEIARKSNLGIVDACVKSGVKVAAFAICNELYAKKNLMGWSGAYTYASATNLANINKFADQYFELVRFYDSVIPAECKIAVPMGTDLNAARKAWDTAMYARMIKGRHILDAHLYPSKDVTGLALASLIKKRLDRGATTGYGMIIGEMNSDMGMYGTEGVPTYTVIENGVQVKKPYPLSVPHWSHINSMINELPKYGVEYVCLHKAGGFAINNNAYDLIRI